MGAMREGQAWTPPATRELTAGGGRVLRYCCYGPADGLPVVSLAGTPGTRWERPDVITAFERAALRVAAPDRPGYGGSTRQPGRTVADVAADVQMIADAHGWPRFAVTGFSGGGPHALACAALLPGRCRAAVTVAGTAPYGSPGLDWLAGMGPENVEGFTIALAGDPQLAELLTAAAASIRAVTGEQVVTTFGGVVDEKDKAALAGEFADYTAARLRAAVRNGIAGWHGDELAIVGKWGFTLDDPAMPPVAIWHGDQDRMVPYAHGEWLARNVAGARAHLMPGEGHLSLVATAIGDILDDLTGMASRG
jgi:pimeloyl-ACP methyl ester carboxylesterase